MNKENKEFDLIEFNEDGLVEQPKKKVFGETAEKFVPLPYQHRSMGRPKGSGKKPYKKK